MQKRYGKVAVIMGGDTPEREVSFLSGHAVLASLQKSGVEAYSFDPLVQPLGNLKQEGFQRAVIMLHGKNGEDGKIQGALEYLKIPYTGSGVMASAICMDKYRTKLIWQALGIPLAKSQYVEHKDYLRTSFNLELDFPVVVKPVDDGSTLGLTKVYQLDDLKKALELAFSNSTRVLIEELIIGAEFTITVIDGKVYPKIKIVAPEGEYDFEHKYYSEETVYLCPFSLGELDQTIDELAIKAYNAVGASGVARIDFMQDVSGKLYFLEINTIPGMTSHSLVPMAASAVGINFEQLCLLILDDAKLNK